VSLLLSWLAQFCLILLRWISRVHKNGFLVPIWSTALNFSVTFKLYILYTPSYI
jgi:hypothetical protein